MTTADTPTTSTPTGGASNLTATPLSAYLRPEQHMRPEQQRGAGPMTDDTRIPPLLRTRDLRLTYGARQALDGVDLDLAPGRIVGLLGPNGCGKTSLLKILAGVLTGYSGEATIAGHAPGPESKALVSFLPDASALPNGARVSTCIAMYRDFFADFDEDRAHELVGFFGLDESMRLKQMSKGMREKVQIALALSRRARVYLLDEPISGVDPAARQTILDGILRGFDDDALMIVSTHLVHDLEPALDAAVFMDRGRVVLTGMADELREEHSAGLDQIFRGMFR
ncbi:ABC transporter ATP-binding protein [Brevibacterium jeotgali]|uniref:ABC-2 type transport system ATP-binding protein n=1 Tax=Brevibacterium jeotgali TaxID=1262550 RepID=A0A2H1L1B8_9MICO|nr:ABC transporter ATP-binding protein [Brevibacterium jeotgali]TWC01943.1 ABC-2 type transport system ATP-binding protein [Brevibacterium jeotgali]SMY10706.1 ABC-2 type transport system ATP-binding protein [Brevibacterium jeotgali]